MSHGADIISENFKLWPVSRSGDKYPVRVQYRTEYEVHDIHIHRAVLAGLLVVYHCTVQTWLLSSIDDTPS